MGELSHDFLYMANDIDTERILKYLPFKANITNIGGKKDVCIFVSQDENRFLPLNYLSDPGFYGFLPGDKTRALPGNQRKPSVLGDLREKQEAHEKKRRDYESLISSQRDEWRQSIDDARGRFLQNPATGGEKLQKEMELANEELRSSLRSLKVELAESANARDAARQAFQENLRLFVHQCLDGIRGTRRRRDLFQMFRAFPDIMPSPATLSPFDDKFTFVPEISVSDYLWLDVKAVINKK